MNYENFILLSLILLLIITFCIHIQQKKIVKKNTNKPKKPVISKKINLSGNGKSFGEYIPPKTKCSPEKGCHTGSYSDFSRIL